MHINNIYLRKILFSIRLFFIRSKRWISSSFVYKNPRLSFYLEKRFFKQQYRTYIGEELDFSNPASFNAKLQWLKLYGNRNSEYTKLVDKLAVRDYVDNIIGKKYLNKLIRVYDNVNEINFDELPEKFVLRLNHGSGWNIICKNKHELDKVRTMEKLTRWYNTNYYDVSKEWAYRDIPPKILCENYLDGEKDFAGRKGYGLLDYKVFCFHRLPRYIQVDVDRYANHMRAFYDIAWNKQPFSTYFPIYKGNIIKPENLGELLELARLLAPDTPFSRIDFYNFEGKIFFGEITFFHGGGHEVFLPPEYDLELGRLIKLPQLVSRN